LLLRDPSELDELEQRTLSFLEENPIGKHLADLVQSFVKLLRKRDVRALDPWLERSMTCGIPDMESFAASDCKKIILLFKRLSLSSGVMGRSRVR
jgi:hypothetical protein